MLNIRLSFIRPVLAGSIFGLFAITNIETYNKIKINLLLSTIFFLMLSFNNKLPMNKVLE